MKKLMITIVIVIALLALIQPYRYDILLKEANESKVYDMYTSTLTHIYTVKKPVYDGILQDNFSGADEWRDEYYNKIHPYGKEIGYNLLYIKDTMNSNTGEGTTEIVRTQEYRN